MIKTSNEFQEETLQKFKKTTEDLEQDDPTLIRFLKAREYDVGKAEIMLREAIKWRETNEIDILSKWDVPQYLRDEMPYRITGIDYDGGSVAWIPMGRWNHRPWIEDGFANEILQWAYYFMEHGLRCIKDSKSGRNQLTVIFGLEEISYYKVSHLDSLKTLYTGFQVLEKCYPEILKKLIVVNAPWIFNIPFNFIKSILSEHTRSKITVFGTNKKEWMPFLLENIPKESLPKEYFKD